MTIHKSLKLGSNMSGTRNVFTRWERLKKLREAGRWSEGDDVYGLPKVSTRAPKVVKKKTKKEKKAEAEAARQAAKEEAAAS